MLQKFNKYAAIFSLTFNQGLKNYKLLFGLSLFLITCLIIFAHLWKVAAIRTHTDFNPETLLWYIAFNEWILISIPEVQKEMQEDFQSGRLAYLLPRPISYLGAVFAEGFAQLVLQLVVLGSVTFLFAFLWTETFPLTFLQFALMLLLGLCAGILGLLLQMLIGLSSFWLHDVTPVNWVWEKLLFIFGGLILPLSAYPLWLQKVAALTPFSPILGGRSGLIFGFDQSQIFSLFGLLALWFIIGSIALKLVYRRGLKILNISGG